MNDIDFVSKYLATAGLDHTVIPADDVGEPVNPSDKYQKVSEQLTRILGPNRFLNGNDWSVDTWHLFGDYYLCEDENDTTFSIVERPFGGDDEIRVISESSIGLDNVVRIAQEARQTETLPNHIPG